MKRLIIFIVRRRLGLKKGEGFRFDNQKSDSDWYYFTKDRLMKVQNGYLDKPSNVRLNWLLDDECKIKKINVRVR